jgi:hypothetical protein
MNQAIELLTKLPDREQAYLDLCRAFFDGNAEIKCEIIQGWDFGVPWEYPDPYRLCSKNQMGSCEDRILASLFYYIVTEMGPDVREEIVDLAIIYNSCILSNLKPDRIFQRVMIHTKKDVTKLMSDFLNRKEDDKSLEAFCLVVKEDLDGEKYLEMSYLG